jgi:hypothetical protein
MARSDNFGDSAWDALVATTDGIDRWCTASAWSASSGDAFGTGRLVVFDDQEGYAVRLRHETSEDGDHGGMLQIVTGPDPVWGFASAVVGDVGRATARVVDHLRRDDEWDVALLPGVEPGSVTERVMGTELVRHFAVVRVGADTIRLVAHLAGGDADGDAGGDADGDAAWFAARSPLMRRNLRRAERTAAAVGLTFEAVDTADLTSVMERLLDVEERSWKGAQDTGIASPTMAAFCSGVLTRLRPVDRRVTFARWNGADVGFIVGGVRARDYRGVQISYTRDVASYSVGHLLQWHEIRRLAGQGVVRYDLGMDIEYKHRFADERYVTRSFIIVRNEQ